MPTHPIRVPWSSYRGNNPRLLRKAKRHNEVAGMCEDYLNRKVAENAAEVQVYEYYSIAHDLNLPLEEVRNVMFAVDCGHNGITIRKSASVEVARW